MRYASLLQPQSCVTGWRCVASTITYPLLRLRLEAAYVRSPTHLHADAIVIDTHADTPQRFVDEGWNFSDPRRLRHDRASIPRQAGGLAAEFFAIWVEPVEWSGRFAYRTLQLIDGVYEQLRRHPTTMRLGLNPQDIRDAHRDGVFCALLGIEGGHSIENDLGLLRL